MKRLAATLVATLAATPALAAGDTFFSLLNTDFVVLLAFLTFIGILIYFKVPGMLGKMLDDRATGIQSDLDEARALREEAQSLLASYERKQREVSEQADRIVANAREEAERAAEASKAEIKRSVERRLAAAGEQIEAAQAAAVKEVRDRAVEVAVAAAREVIAAQTTAQDQDRLIDDAIGTVGAKLH